MPFTIPARRFGGALVALALACSLVPAVAGPVAASGGSGFVAMANGYRADANRGPVALHAVIDQIAVERGRQVAAERALVHDFDYIRERLDDENICWRGFGEILAWNGSGDFGRFGEQWYNSTTHRNIMLGDYTHAGGHRQEAGGRWYGTMVFVKLCNASTSTPTTSSFTDLGNSIFIDDIEWLEESGITGGCATTRFCPTSPVARDQMATMLDRAFGFAPAGTDYFRDDSASVHESAINQARQASVTGGCYSERYCPYHSVTRAQMAAFLARVLGLPPAQQDHFYDDEGTMHEDSINRLAEAGVAGGCAAGRFCPGQVVTREQMAAFLHRALGD